MRGKMPITLVIFEICPPFVSQSMKKVVWQTETKKPNITPSVNRYARDCHEFLEVIYLSLESCVWLHRPSQRDAVDYSVVRLMREESRVEGNTTEFCKAIDSDKIRRNLLLSFSLHAMIRGIIRNRYPVERTIQGPHWRKLQKHLWMVYMALKEEVPYNFLWHCRSRREWGYPDTERTRSNEYLRIILKRVKSWADGYHECKWGEPKRKDGQKS